MFVGFILSVLIIVFYAIYAAGKYATKKEVEELRRRLDGLEKAGGEKPKVAAAAGAIEGGE